MRLLKALIAFAALAAALPDPGDWVDPKAAATRDVPTKLGKYDNMPILDARIDAHEKEGRTVNLSPHNNPRSGLFPRQCRSHSTCPCASSAGTGLWCGYCVSPVDAIPECRGQDNPCLNWVYQCGPGRDCCTFGVRTSCSRRQGPCGG